MSTNVSSDSSGLKQDSWGRTIANLGLVLAFIIVAKGCDCRAILRAVRLDGADFADR